MRGRRPEGFVSAPKRKRRRLFRREAWYQKV
jgi:hypothetical protein